MGISSQAPNVEVITNKERDENLVKYTINLRKKVKSFYIIKNIFSFLQEKKKLNLIIYNKKFKIDIGVSIEDYKETSGKIIIGDRNGKGKEVYNDGRLIYDGEYLNGKRNGKGKEYYDNGKLKFSGIYSNDVRNGKGKEYHPFFGDLIFEGEYLNGQRIGK